VSVCHPLLSIRYFFIRSGKCIGEKNMPQFRWMLSLCCFQVYYLLFAFIYYLVYAISSATGGSVVPVGSGF
jgi:succinate dehydrogenase/fumarate reductase cytochrome b subunit